MLKHIYTLSFSLLHATLSVLDSIFFVSFSPASEITDWLNNYIRGILPKKENNKFTVRLCGADMMIKDKLCDSSSSITCIYHSKWGSGSSMLEAQAACRGSCEITHTIRLSNLCLRKSPESEGLQICFGGVQIPAGLIPSKLISKTNANPPPPPPPSPRRVLHCFHVSLETESYQGFSLPSFLDLLWGLSHNGDLNGTGREQ